MGREISKSSTMRFISVLEISEGDANILDPSFPSLSLLYAVYCSGVREGLAGSLEGR